MVYLGGLVFPQSVLVSPWFQLLATVVAFNTIVYLGLTLSKFVPWPRQLSSRGIRGLFGRPDASLRVDAELSTREVARNPLESMRGDIVARDVPLGLSVVGGTLVIVSAINLIAIRANNGPYQIIVLICGLIFVVMAFVLGRRGFRPMVTVWIWSSLVVLAAAIVASAAVREDSIAPLGYALIFMVGFGPIAMSWPPVIVSMVTQLAIFAYAVGRVGDAQGVQFAVVGLAAAATGVLMLKLRLQSITQLATQWQATQEVASTDPLTGLLTRRGLWELVPEFTAAAVRQGQQLTVTVVSLANLGSLNATYGADYGDGVLRSTAKALTSSTDRNFLVARWIGAQFVVLGYGLAPHEAATMSDIGPVIAAGPVTLGKAPLEVAVGSARGEAREGQFTALYDRAVENMAVAELPLSQAQA